MWTAVFLATPEPRTLVAATLMVAWASVAARLWRGMAQLPRWSDGEPTVCSVRGGGPVSLVVAARNEAAALEAAARSWCAVRGLDEIVVVDDRSTDATPAILARLAAVEPRLRVERVDAVPPGWLGKTHALHRGATTAGGQWLLFTDADIVFAPDAVERAIALCASRDLDHLAGILHVELHTWRERVLMGVFRLHFHLGLRTWRVGDPASRAAVGVGGFHLLRRELYDALGGHTCVRLAVVDDIELAREAKVRGSRSAVVLTGGVVRVRWYAGVRDTVRGLTKNFFAGADYSVALSLAAAAGLMATHLGPLALVCAPGGTVAGRLLAAGAALAQAAAYRAAGEPWGTALGSPLGACGAAFALVRSMTATIARGAVEWRETRYSLALLRRFHGDARLRRAALWRARQEALRMARRQARRAARRRADGVAGAAPVDPARSAQAAVDPRQSGA